MTASDFLRYIGDNPDLKPNAAFKAEGGRGEVPPGGWGFNSFPRGTAFVFPSFFAFLTTRKYSGNARAYGEDLAHDLLGYAREMLKVHRWMADPTTIVFDLAKALDGKYRGEAVLSKAILNPHSFFVPFSEIASVASGGGYTNGVRKKSLKEAFEQPYIRLSTPSDTYVVSQEVNLSFWNLVNIKSTYEVVTSRWQTDTFEFLRMATQTNDKAAHR